MNIQYQYYVSGETRSQCRPTISATEESLCSVSRSRRRQRWHAPSGTRTRRIFNEGWPASSSRTRRVKNGNSPSSTRRELAASTRRGLALVNIENSPHQQGEDSPSSTMGIRPRQRGELAASMGRENACIFSEVSRASSGENSPHHRREDSPTPAPRTRPRQQGGLAPLSMRNRPHHLGGLVRINNEKDSIHLRRPIPSSGDVSPRSSWPSRPSLVLMHRGSREDRSSPRRRGRNRLRPSAPYNAPSLARVLPAVGYSVPSEIFPSLTPLSPEVSAAEPPLL